MCKPKKWCMNNSDLHLLIYLWSRWWAANALHYIASNDRIIMEYWIREDMKERSCAPVWGHILSICLEWLRKAMKTSVRIVGLWTEIHTEDFQDAMILGNWSCNPSGIQRLAPDCAVLGSVPSGAWSGTEAVFSLSFFQFHLLIPFNHCAMLIYHYPLRGAAHCHPLGL